MDYSSVLFAFIDLKLVAAFCLLLTITCIYCVKTYLRLTSGKCKSGRDLRGKVVIITGANTGIGKETARDLAKRNARVILACRSLEKGREAAGDIVASTGNSDIHVKNCDLSSLSSVRNFADDILSSEERLDVLICNAGSGAPFGRHLTEDGFELQFQTNHLGHFLLVNLLADLLKESTPSRVVITSSLAHRFGTLDLENMIRFERHINHPFLAYSDTKLANVLFMKELSRRFEGTGVLVNALHPGTINTNGVKYNTIWYIRIFLLFLCFLYNKTEKDGAQTIIHLAVAEEVDGVTGQYFSDCHPTNYSPLADDKLLSRRLWEVSHSLCRLSENAM